MKKLVLRMIKNNIKIGNKTIYNMYRMYDILEIGIIHDKEILLNSF